MATKWYLSNSTVTDPPTVNPGWNNANQAITAALTPTPTGGSTSVAGSETSNVNGYQVLLGKFVSPPILNDGPLQGSYTLTFARSANSTNSMITAYSIYVVDQLGNVRATAVNERTQTTAWPTGATAISATGTLTAIAAFPGDRIVVDIASQASITTTSNRIGTIYYGGTSGTDLGGSDTGSNAQNRPGWVQFDSIDGLFVPLQRLYLTNTPAAISPAFSPTTGGTPPVSGSGGWEDTSVAGRHTLSTTKAGSVATSARTETSSTANWDVLLGQWVSPPLVNAGTLKNVFAWTFAGSASAANVVTRCLIKVVSGDGTTVREYMGNNQGPTGAAFTSTPTGVGVSAAIINDLRFVDFEVGDRVVVELGSRSLDATASPTTVTMWYGGTASPDLDNTDTDTDLPGSIDIPDNLLFGTDAAEIEGTAQATLGALSAQALGTVTAEVVPGQAQALLGALAAQALGEVIAEVVTAQATAQLGALSAHALGTVTAEVIAGTAQAQLGALSAQALGEVTAEVIPGQAQAALGQLTASATGEVTAEVVQATAQALLGSLTASATGDVLATAQATATLGELQATALGTVTAEVVTGTAQANLGTLTATALGEGTAEVVSGTAQALLGALTAQALGSVTAEVVTGTAIAQLGALAANATGTRSTTGTVSADLGPLGAQALGTVIAEAVPGQAAAALGQLAAQATGDVAVTATAQANLGGLAAQANATGASTGTAQALLGGLVATADGTVTAEVVTGAATALLGALLAAATATGSSAGTAQAVLGALAASASGDVLVAASAQAQLGALTATALGEGQAEVVPGAAQAELGALVAAATGSGQAPTITGTAQAQLGSLTAQALADVLVPALASAQLGGLLASSSGRRTRHGFAQAVLGPLVATVLVTPPVVFAEMHPATVPAPALSGAARSGPTMKGA